MDEFERQLLRRLRELPVPPPSAGFAARALKVGRAPAWRPAAAFAMAAALLAAVALPVWMVARDSLPGEPGGRVVAMAAGEVQPVSLMLRSPRALSGVTVVVQLPEGVELAGYPERRELTWQTDLQAGANRLDLPVVLRHGSGGVVTAALTLGKDRREIAVQVQARQAAPAGGAAADHQKISV
jgi:hypothetical protein